MRVTMYIPHLPGGRFYVLADSTRDFGRDILPTLPKALLSPRPLEWHVTVSFDLNSGQPQVRAEIETNGFYVGRSNKVSVAEQ